MAAPERLFLPVEGFPGVTEAWVLRGGGTTPDAQTAAAAAFDTTVVVLPGNPGIAHAYTLFLERLREEWAHRAALSRRKAVRFIAVSYAGHVVPPPAESTTGKASSAPASAQRFTLEQQVEHKLRFLERHVLPTTKRELVIVGHSIGAHISLCLAKRLRKKQQPLRIASVLLTPFLSTNPSCHRQRAVRRLASCHALAGAVATLAGRLLSALPLPEALHLRLASWASGADHHGACRGIAGLLAPHVVDSALFLARDEFATLPEGVSGLPLVDLERVGEVCLVGGRDDMWWPQTHHAAVARRFESAALASALSGEDGVVAGAAGSAGAATVPALSAIWDEQVSHLFGCSAQETIAVAEHVAKWCEGRSKAQQ